MKHLNRQTLIIGLDGASFTILDYLMENGLMPFLKELISSGCRGELLSVVPPLTPPAWTSLMTGFKPGNHGVFDFFQFESPKSRYVKWVSFRDIQRETIWSIVNRYGMRAGSLNFVAMNPPPSISGYVIPGFVSWRWLKKNSHPADLFDRLQTIPDFDLKEMALNFKEEEKAVKGCQKEDYENWISLHIRRERQWFQVLRYLMQSDPCELVGVVFDGLDRIQHICWRFLDPAYFLHGSLLPWEKRVQELCWQYFRQLDSFLEEIVYLAGSWTNTFIVSDHGFGPTKDILHINQWLKNQGYLAWKNDDFRIEEDNESIGVESPYRSLLNLDWKKTRAYTSTASSNGIIIPIAGKRGEYGIPIEEYFNFRQELIDKLKNNCCHPHTGVALIKRILTKEESFAGESIDDAPDLTLVLQDSGFVSINPSEDGYFQSRAQVGGTHCPEGIFIANGPCIRTGQRIGSLSIIDVAPAVLYSLGLPIPADMEGQLRHEVFTPDYLKKYPIKIGSPTLRPERYHEALSPTEDTEGQEQMMLRLKSLGYI